MDTSVQWLQVSGVGYPSHLCTTEWLVELRPLKQAWPKMALADTSIPATIEIVKANNPRQAAFVALSTRNIPDNWLVTKIERG